MLLLLLLITIFCTFIKRACLYVSFYGFFKFAALHCLFIDVGDGHGMVHPFAGFYFHQSLSLSVSLFLPLSCSRFLIAALESVLKLAYKWMEINPTVWHDFM